MTCIDATLSGLVASSLSLMEPAETDKRIAVSDFAGSPLLPVQPFLQTIIHDFIMAQPL